VTRVVAIAALIAFAATAIAAPPSRKVLVLPLDGNVDPATRAKLTASVQKLARVIDGQVKQGDTNFADAAAAVGCDPKAPSCADTVRTTLNVDEVVYGTATQTAGTITVVVRRKSKDAPPREITATLADKDPPDRIETAVLPLFTGSTPPPPVVEPPAVEPQPEPAPIAPPPIAAPIAETPHPVSRERALAIAATAGGGAMVLVGLILWRGAGGLQQEIDDHPANTAEDFEELQRLEDKAGSRATFGNVMVFGGIALAGVGVWMLWREHRRASTSAVLITPAPVAGGATLTLTVRR
jgi:hypothetical protein